MSILNPTFAQRADSFKRELKHTKVFPKNIVEFLKDDRCFQGLGVKKIAEHKLPIILNSGDSVILNFGDHCVGYLNFSVNHVIGKTITDSPVQLKFTFGEFPYEITTPPESYKGSLGSGWLQNETKSIVFTPYNSVLERRYSFKYVKIERLDKACFPIQITDMFVDCVSAVDMADVKPVNIPDKKLEQIYNMSLKTLKECEQDVFEDGPKRDRRLWMGDLRLQALTDYYTFRNLDLIIRCIYLFAAYLTDKRCVASCLFPDSYPYVDEWNFSDYSLYFVSCLLDYTVNTGDKSVGEELYDIAEEQVKIFADWFNSVDEDKSISHSFFIDWCENLDKDVAYIGVYLYVLKQLSTLANLLNKKCDFVVQEIQKASKRLFAYYSAQEEFFMPNSKQISWHSQVWAVLSGELSNEDAIKLLKKTASVNPEYIMHTPYMMHFYVEALFNCGLKDEAMNYIRETWGKMVDYGYDCCPELFNTINHFESPYGAPELNSACHAWSCTPAYWIHKYYFV